MLFYQQMDSRQILDLPFLHLPLLLIGLIVLYYTSLAVYYLYFHPLSKFPGPRIAAATHLWQASSLARGTAARDILSLHDRYGPVIRISPDELSYVALDAWKDIYGYKPRQPELAKDPRYHTGMQGSPNIVNADREEHRYLRRLLVSSFSEKSIKEQEHVLQRFVDILMSKLYESCRNGQNPQDMMSWFNFTTFDIMGVLTYGETFDCLVNSALHSWVSTIFDVIRVANYGQAASRLPWILHALLKPFIAPKSVLQRAKANNVLIKDKVLRRLGNNSPFPDLMFNFVQAYHSGKMPFDRLMSNAMIMTVGGSETTATLMSGVTYHLLQNPEAYRKLVKEVRDAFQSSKEITISEVNKLSYLSACLEEASRIYPPSPVSHTRITPPEGVTIVGENLPGGLGVGVPMYAMFNCAGNFRNPHCFIPERWLGDPAYVSDARAAVQPFSYGPRDCIGRRLAQAEMRLVITKLLWHFDLELCRESENWSDQKNFLLWEKGPLWINLRQVERT